MNKNQDVLLLCYFVWSDVKYAIRADLC